MESLKLCIDHIKNTRISVGILAFLFFSGSGKAQQFSTRLHSLSATQLINVLVCDSQYLFVGNAIDTTGIDHSSLLIGVVDLEGEVSFEHQHYSDEFDFDANFDVNTRLNDSVSVVGVWGIYTDNDTLYTTLLWLRNNGDTIRTRRYFSPYYHSDGDPEGYSKWMQATAMCSSPDGQFIYFVSQIIDYPPVQNGFIVKKLNAVGDEIWTYEYPVSDTYYMSTCIQYYQDSLYLISYGSGGENYPRILNINNDTGLPNWSHQFTDFVSTNYLATDFILYEGNIVATGKLFNDVFESIPLVYQIDLDGEYIWYANPGGEYNSDHQNDHIALAQDGGYVCCSEQNIRYLIPDEESTNPVHSIWLWKVDETGQLKWERHYEYFSLDSGYWNLHNVAHDFKATPDGGFICAGEATALCTDHPECDHSTQQGWLLKVDGCGCLVPGCDEECYVGVSDRHPDESQYLFKVGPNPARDFINVFLPARDLNFEDLNLELFSLDGHLIKSFPIKHGDTTYMIDTTGLTSGEYVLSLLQENKLLQQEKILVIQ